MDNFDVRKYITEAKLSEQKKAYIKYADGSTEDRMFHQSVSDDKIKKMLAPGTFIDGKQVLKVLVGGSLDQAMNEDEGSLNHIVQWANKELDFELSPNMQDLIAHSLEQGVTPGIIKKQLSSKNPIKIKEEKDVLEPEEDASEDEDTQGKKGDTFKYDYKESEEARKKNKKEVDAHLVKSIKGFDNMDDMDRFKGVDKNVYKYLKILRDTPFYENIVMDSRDIRTSLQRTAQYIAYLIGYNMSEEEIEDKDLVEDYSLFIRRLFKLDVTSSDFYSGHNDKELGIDFDKETGDLDLQ